MEQGAPVSGQKIYQRVRAAIDAESVRAKGTL
jgi:hypothetical protein